MTAGEYAKFGEFKEMWYADGKKGTEGNLRYSTIMSGLTFYLYNEVSTMALKSLSGVSHSVANTAKRAVVIVGSAIAFGEDMGFLKALGCSIAIVRARRHTSSMPSSMSPPSLPHARTSLPVKMRN